jgi:uncharacterized integral membrane protein
MRYLGWIFKLALFLVLVGFALKNMEAVPVRLFLGAQWEVPLSLVMLLFFSGGAVLGALSVLSATWRRKRNAARREASAALRPPSAL